MGENVINVSDKKLVVFIKELFMVTGMNADDADFNANALINTNLWGVDSHGVIRVPAYFNRMMSKAVNVNPDIKKIKGGKALEVIDGDNATGFIVAKTAMERAIELAKEHNIAAVGAINSNHFGAGAIYSRMAAEAGMIGISMTNVIPLVTAPGASKPVVGNNPIAISIPTYGECPFTLDMALSKVAGGKLTLAIKKGEKIPFDWATDKYGRPTDDPKEAFEGFLLPMGDFKGLGLAYVVDILCGVITGGVFSHQMKSMYAYPNDPSLTGHFMIAINIDAIIGKEDMKARMKEYYDRLKATPCWKENTEMYFPGELENIKSIERKESGIPIPVKTYEELMELKAKYNIAADIERI